MAVTTAHDAAQYLLWHAAKYGDSITNLKMQKLLYYAQGWYLGLHGKILFDDEFEAWVRGPVISKLYGQFRYNGSSNGGAVPLEAPATRPAIPKAAADHLDEVWKSFSGYSAFQLEAMTHAEPPWMNARKGLRPTQASRAVISVEEMRAYFEKLASDES